MSDETESSTDASDTYAQIVVPSYALNNTVADAGNMVSSTSTVTTTGSSFLRLGSFPSLTDAADQPSGFANSLALAQLVGGASPTYPSTAALLASNLEETGSDPSPAALLTSDTYLGDTTLFLGFAEDTRYRSGEPNSGEAYIDWTDVYNTVDVRQAETNRLLFKGGWWDHADGNRITTTCGDKIEVIQGNYKMIVLGRQNPADGSSGLSSNAVVTDLSGGQALASCYTPGAGAVAIEYTETDGVWTAYESGTGNMVSTYSGNQESYTYGSTYNTYVGWDPDGNNNSPQLSEDKSDPAMISKTWAKSIETYVGSEKKPVPNIYSRTDCKTMNTVTNAYVMDSITNCKTMNSTTEVAATNSLTIAAEVTCTTVAPLNVSINVGYTHFVYGGPCNTTGIDKEEVFATGAEIKALHTELEMLHTKLCGTTMTLAEERTLLSSINSKVTESDLSVSLDTVIMSGEIAML